MNPDASQASAMLGLCCLLKGVLLPPLVDPIVTVWCIYSRSSFALEVDLLSTLLMSTILPLKHTFRKSGLFRFLDHPKYLTFDF